MDEIYHVLQERELLYTEATTVLPAVTLWCCRLIFFFCFCFQALLILSFHGCFCFAIISLQVNLNAVV